MIITTSFLQYVAVAKKTPHQPGGTHNFPASRSQNPATWLAVLIAGSLHLAWLAMSGDDTQKEVVTPAKPIMINWIDSPAAKTAALPTPKAEPKPEPKLEKTKLQPRPKAVKPQPVVASHDETASTTTAPVSEPIANKPATEAPAQPAPAARSASPVNSPTESDQKPSSLPSLNADYLNNPPPAYPPESRQFGEQGKVLLRVLVNANGAVEQVNLRKSSGYQRLDQAAQDTVQHWRFVPAKRGEQAVTAWVVVPISFSLEG